MLPLVVACLDHLRTGSLHIVRLLNHFCFDGMDVSGDHADLLARLKGVLRLSNAMFNVQTRQAGIKAAGMCVRPTLGTAGQPAHLHSNAMYHSLFHVKGRWLADLATSDLFHDRT